QQAAVAAARPRSGHGGRGSPPRDGRRAAEARHSSRAASKPRVSRTAQSRPRVLMLVEQIKAAGGAEVFAVGLATHLPRDRFDVRLCTTRLTGGFLERTLDDAGVPHFNLARSGRWDLVRFRRLYSYLR